MSYNFSNFKLEVKKAEDFLSKVYRELNIGRASPMVLDSLVVEAYGDMQPLKNVASINVEDPKTLRIAPWDKTHIKGIEKAIMISDLGLSTAVDDAGVRVIFPQLTTENRQKLVKVLKEKLEDARITVRQVRQDAMSDIENSGMTEDEVKRAKDELQKIVDEVNKNLEESFKKKEAEVMN
jgi:ribosome recycling factor